ncbi:MAG: kynureninase [Pseudomonadota bacterium]
MNRAECQAMDQQDSLSGLREKFLLDEGLIYLDGNSLGPMPLAVAARVAETTQAQWGRDLVTSWNRHNWIDLPVRVGEKIAHLVGAAPGQVICTDSTSVNLFKVLSAALSLRPERRVILSTRDNFPTDLYMAEGLAALLGKQRCELRLVDSGKVHESLDRNLAVLMLTEVNFRTGARFDMAALTAAAHAVGALVIWDLAHSAGALPVQLDEANADFAVGCSYKYLNGGPGAPGFLYVAARHLESVTQPLSGWMGHASPFDFSPGYSPGAGIRRFATGTPAVISMSALDTALTVFDGVDMAQVRNKSVKLAEVFISCVEAAPDLAGLELLSPRDPTARGSQVSFSHPGAYAMIQALIERGIIGDFREPDILRFGLCPLFLRFVDVFDAVNTLAEIVRQGSWQAARFQQRQPVT